MKKSSILRLPVVVKRTGKSRSSIYADIKKKQFPTPIQIGAKSVGWLESEIEDWIQNQIAQSRKLAD